jgi:hypothetical protein
MELFTTVAFTVGLFVLLGTFVTAFLMIKTDVFTAPRVQKSAPAAAMAPVSFDHTPRELVSS